MEKEPEVENKTIKVEPTDPGETHASDNDPENDPDNDPDPGEGPSSLIRDPKAGLCEPKPGPSHKIIDDDEDDSEDEDEDEDEDDANLPLVVWEQPRKVDKEEPMDYEDNSMPGPSQAKPLHNWDSASDSDSEISAASCRIQELHGPDDEEEDGQARAPKQKSIFCFKKKDIPAADAPAPADDMTLILPESVELQPFGRVSGIIEKLVIIESVTDLPPVCEDSMIFKSNRHAAGKIFEIFGPVAHPFYVLRFSCLEHIKRKDIKIRDIMYFAPSIQHFTRYIFTDRIRDRGSDASWKNDLEPPPEAIDFSDDEKEKAAKSKKKYYGRNRKKQRAEYRSKSRSSYSRDGRKGFRAESRQLALQEIRQEEAQEEAQEEKQEEAQEEAQEEKQEEKQENKQETRQASRQDTRLGARQDTRLGARERTTTQQESRQGAHRDQRKGGRQDQRKSSRHDHRHSSRHDHRQDRRQMVQHDHRQLLQQEFRQEYCPEFGQEFGQEFGGQEYGQAEFGQVEYGQQEFPQEYQEFPQEYPQEYRAAAAAAAAATTAAEYHQEYRPAAEYRPDYQNLGAYGGEAPVHWCPQPREAGRSCYSKREYHREFSRGRHHKSSHSRSQTAGQFYNAEHRLAQDAPPSLFAPQPRQDNSLMQHSYQLAPQYFDMHHYQAHPSQHVAWSGLSQHVHNAHYQHFQGHHSRGGGHCSQYRPYY